MVYCPASFGKPLLPLPQAAPTSTSSAASSRVTARCAIPSLPSDPIAVTPGQPIHRLGTPAAPAAKVYRRFCHPGDPFVRRFLMWSLRWYRRRALRTQILIALLLAVIVLYSCVAPPMGGPRAGPTPRPGAAPG